MIVIVTIGATMTMPIAPRLPVLSAITAEPAMTRTQTSEPTINHAVDEADVAGAPAQLEHAVSQPQERPLLQPHLPARTQPHPHVPVAVGAVGRSAVLRQDPAAVKPQTQMTAGDQRVAEDLAASQESAVPDGHHQAAVRTVQDGKVPRAGQGGQSRVRGSLTRRALEQRG